MSDNRRLVKLPADKTFTCRLCGGSVIFWTTVPLNRDGNESVDWSQLMTGAQCSVCLASLSHINIEIKQKIDI
jgi:transcription elongation factor Elf1